MAIPVGETIRKNVQHNNAPIPNPTYPAVAASAPPMPDFSNLVAQFRSPTPITQSPSLAGLMRGPQSNYDSEAYLQSLAASRADVERQVGNVLGEIGRQRDVNLGQAAQIPGQLQQVFQPAQAAAQNQNLALQQAIQAGGVRGPSFMADARSAPILAALAQQQSAFGGTVPLLQAGFNELATRQAGGANNLAQTLLTDINSQGREYIGRRESEDREAQRRAQELAAQQEMERQQREADRQFQAEMAAREHAAAQSRFNAEQAASQQRFLAELAAQRDPVADDLAVARGRAEIEREAANQAPQYKLSDFGAKEINPLRGQVLPAADVAKITGDKRWQSDLKKTQEIIAKYGTDPAKVVAEARKFFGDRNRTASLALWQLGYRA